MEKEKGEVLKAPLFENLRKLINVIDELRDVGLQNYITLPRIAVLGTQSSGKSSLLESIVGLDFLPRGEGVVTRRPLEMRLVHIQPTGADDKPWAIFDNNKNEKFINFEKVREKINELTDKQAGKNKGIIDEPIILTVYSTTCPDLTIIDLPGITRIPLQNSDQPKDIEKITKNMALTYVKDKRTIILCVIPANADISTSDGLQMARELDPEGVRTIGVITKIDIMDKGTNAKRMLLGQDIALKLGYVGVKGRSQQDINDKMSVAKGLEVEAEYFSKHAVYSTMTQGYLGTKALTKKLTDAMFFHIRKLLPEIVKEISEKIKDCEIKLKELGPPLPRETKDKIHLLWNMITDFTEEFKNTIRGKYDGRRHSKKLDKETSGGAAIKMMFNDIYSEFIGKKFKATDEYSDKDIEKAILFHQGDSIPGFPSFDSFLYLIQPQLEKLKEPAVDCVQNVFIFMENLASKLIERIFARFQTTIISEITENASSVLQAERDKAKEVVENIIDSELGYLFTNDLDYLMNRTNIIPKAEKAEKDPQTLFVNEMRQRIDAYFNLAVRNMRDSIPKAIGYFLVKASQEKMQYALYNEVMKNEGLLNLLGEPAHISNERDTISKTLEVLRKAQRVLKKDPDLAAIDRAESMKYQSEESEEKKNDDDAGNRKTAAPKAGPGAKTGGAGGNLFGGN